MWPCECHLSLCQHCHCHHYHLSAGESVVVRAVDYCCKEPRFLALPQSLPCGETLSKSSYHSEAQFLHMKDESILALMLSEFMGLSEWRHQPTWESGPQLGQMRRRPFIGLDLHFKKALVEKLMGCAGGREGASPWR